MTIRKRGKKFVLLSGTGKVLGTHSSRSSAAKQELAIQISKARKKGRRTPKKK